MTARNCVTHHHACDCREAAHKAEVDRLTAENARLRVAIISMVNAANSGLIDDEGRHSILLGIEAIGREALAQTEEVK